MLTQAKGPIHYPCPMCGNPVSATAVHCPSCATDLTRAGAVFSSSGASSQPRPRRRRTRILPLAIGLAVAAGALATVGRPWIVQFAEPGMTVLRTMIKGGSGKSPVKTAAPARPASPAKKAAPPAAAPVQTPVQVTPATPAPVPRAATGTFAITSTPAGAEIQIDGVRKGSTPLTVSGLTARSYKIRVARQGYRTVSRTVRLEAGQVVAVRVKLSLQPSTVATAKTVKTAPARPVEAGLLDVGRPAPELRAKDRVGIIFRVADFRGRKLVLLFVQNLDAEAQRLVRDVNTAHGGGPRGVMVVVLRPDRVVIREFIQSSQIQVPLLFGTQTMAQAYGVGSQRAALYLISEDGRIVLRQAGKVNPRVGLN